MTWRSPLRISRVALVAALALGAASTATSPVHAQDTAAEAVFEEGSRLFAAGDYTAACPKLKSAVTLASGEALGGRLLLAECYEKVGRWASAWALYREVVARAGAAGQTARKEKAEAGQARVEPKLARLRVELAPDVASLPGLTMERDGELLPRDVWDLPLPVDPGTVALRLTATGKRDLVTQVTVADAPATVTTRIDRLEDAGSSAATETVMPPPPPPPPPPQAPGGAAPSPSPGSGGLGGLGIAGIVVGGVGVIGMGVGTLLAVGAKSDWEDAVEDEDDEGVDDARSIGDVATGVFIGGALLGAVGITLLVVDRTGSGAPRVAVAVTGSGASLAGDF